jgi:hypothetical protein
MILRGAFVKLLRLDSKFKALAVIGYRQSAKTIPERQLFEDKPYVLPENPDTKKKVLENPREFLASFSEDVVWNEIQRMPDIISYLQGISDGINDSGQYILTGSNNFSPKT